MTAEAQRLIEEFGALSDATKREVLAELIRMSRDLDDPPMADDEMLAAADELFLKYDRREAGE